MSGTGIFNEQLPITFTYAFTNADGLTQQTFPGGGSYGWRWDNIYCSNSDTIDHVINLAFTSGAGALTNLQATIPHGAGVGAVAPFDLTTFLFGTSRVGLALNPADTLQVGVLVAVVAGHYVGIAAFGGNL